MFSLIYNFSYKKFLYITHAKEAKIINENISYVYNFSTATKKTKKKEKKQAPSVPAVRRAAAQPTSTAALLAVLRR
jgi:hypothetical protein